MRSVWNTYTVSISQNAVQIQLYTVYASWNNSAHQELISHTISKEVENYFPIFLASINIDKINDMCATIHCLQELIISYRREPLYEAHDSTFGILVNYHCWRF